MPAMKEFSMFCHALASVSEGVEDLGAVTQVSLRDFDERTTFRFHAAAPCLEYFSLLIENALLLRTHRGGRLYVGFDEEGFGAPVLEARTFSALKTHDPALVRLLASAAESLIDDSLVA